MFHLRMLHRLRHRRHAATLIATASCLVSMSAAHADVFGRLRVVVTDQADKPVPSAVVTFHDNAGVRPDINVTADAQGVALSPPLEIRNWTVTTRVVTFDTNTQTVAVNADTSTPLDVKLNKRVVTTIGRGITIRPSTADTTRRSADFIAKIPATGANPQSFPRLLTANPGFVQSSVNVVHPRGEHAGTSIYINGFELPGVLQGRAGPQFSPDIIQSADIQTGGYAPEYGSETAAIVNLNLKAGTIKPYQSVSADFGGYNTLDQSLTFGGQAGAPAGQAGPLRYLFNFSNRSTRNVLETPQPGNQDAHNHGVSATLFGNIDYVASPRDTFSLILNTAPARTEIANRTGLPDKFTPVGQGYGYGGARNADGLSAGVDPDPALIGSQDIVLKSQQGAGQDVYQNDENRFGLLNLRHTFTPTVTGLLSLGSTRSRLDIRSHNPSIDLSSVDPASGILTNVDNSIEYNPTILRTNSQTELSGSLTSSTGAHTYKGGFLLTRQSGNESYQFTPQSQLALDSLAAVQTGGPQLTPDGTYQTNADGSQVTDVLGNPVYLINPGNTATPVVNVHRSGYYNAYYVQDTWRTTQKLTLNYGLRLDSYYGKQTLSTDTVKKNYLSPRLNAAYAFAPRTTGRLIYDKLFTQPPLAQGAILGTNLVPQTVDHYEAGVQQQIGSGQSVKVSYYYKNFKNQIDTGILIPYTQIGAYTTLQYGSAGVHGLELSYDLNPRGGVGLGGFLAYANSIAKAGGFDQTGANAPIYNDHHQLNTLSAGLSYTLPSQVFFGGEVYYGSGEVSSVLAPIGPSDSNLLNGGSKNSHYSINLRAGAPHLLGPAGLELDIENVTNDVSVLNFNSGFSGTRFQQGRRVLLRVTGGF